MAQNIIDPREAAISFEAIKIGLRQNKDGVVLLLSIHPSDLPRDLMEAWVGTRFQVAMVQIADDGTPKEGNETREGNVAVKVAGALCRNERFRAWLNSGWTDNLKTEDDTAEWLRNYLGIASRAELKTDMLARDKFFNMRDRFVSEIRS